MSPIFLCVWILGLAGIGASQDCSRNFTLSLDRNVAEIDINTTTQFCFIAPVTPIAACQLNGAAVASSPPAIVFNEPNVMINNWTAVNLDNRNLNQLQCELGAPADRETYYANFYSLTPEALQLFGMEPFYIENATVNAVCRNRNQRPGFQGAEVWTNITGGMVEGTTLMFKVTRELAGRYTCSVPTVPEIMPFFYDIVVRYPPTITTTSDDDTVEVNTPLTLECSFVGFPTPNITWTLNDSIAFLSESGVSVDTSQSGTGTTSTLTFDNVTPASARGNYSCFVSNVVGNASMNFAILVASSPEPAAMFQVTDTTNSSISFSWAEQFNGLVDITGARLEYTVVGSGDAPMGVEVGRRSGMVMGLTAFANYNVSLFLRNGLGLSDPVSLFQQTDSNFLEAPSVTLTAVSSTELHLMWQAPPVSAQVDDPSGWTYEFSLESGAMVNTSMVNATTFSMPFSGLEKGTVYRARVAGNNSRGLGAYSAFAMTETQVDPPSRPVNLAVTALSSFAFRSSWEAPVDNGGRPVSGYNFVVLAGSSVLVNRSLGTDLSYTVNDMQMFQPSTDYTVGVSAVNERGPSLAAEMAVTTISIEKPQPVLMELALPNASNITVLLTWSYPGGDVTEYLITITSSDQGSRNITTGSNETMFVVDGLISATTYDVVIRTVNDNGTTPIPSPIAKFTTMEGPQPIVTVSPEGPYEIGMFVTLTCSTVDDTRNITWLRDNLDSDRVMIEGLMVTSTLTIRGLVESDKGEYVCKVGPVRETIILDVFVPTTDPPASGAISNTIIIIAVCTAAGGLLVVAVIVTIIVVLCCCCRSAGDDQPRKSRKSGGYNTNKKKGKDLFEFSANFQPTTNTGITRDSNVSFTMPEEFQGHSSFNTLEKQNKIERSHSPDTTEPTSFGGQRHSKEGLMTDYQMPPSSSDGTML